MVGSAARLSCVCVLNPLLWHVKLNDKSVKVEGDGVYPDVE
jgi:hypothetical protein